MWRSVRINFVALLKRKIQEVANADRRGYKQFGIEEILGSVLNKSYFFFPHSSQGIRIIKFSFNQKL
jgi:hypothetical protein